MTEAESGLGRPLWPRCEGQMGWRGWRQEGLSGGRGGGSSEGLGLEKAVEWEGGTGGEEEEEVASGPELDVGWSSVPPPHLATRVPSSLRSVPA